MLHWICSNEYCPCNLGGDAHLQETAIMLEEGEAELEVVP